MEKEEIVKSVMERVEKENIPKDKIAEVINDELAKAVTSESAPAENAPENDEQLNAENKPTIQEAKTPDELKADGGLDQEVVQNKVPEEVNTDQAEGGKVQEVSFGDMFGDNPFKLGATLEQSPSGNVMANMKPSDMDYVERAKNHSNQLIVPEDLSKDK